MLCFLLSADGETIAVNPANVALVRPSSRTGPSGASFSAVILSDLPAEDHDALQIVQGSVADVAATLNSAEAAGEALRSGLGLGFGSTSAQTAQRAAIEIDALRMRAARFAPPASVPGPTKNGTEPHS